MQRTLTISPFHTTHPPSFDVHTHTHALPSFSTTRHSPKRDTPGSRMLNPGSIAVPSCPALHLLDPRLLRSFFPCPSTPRPPFQLYNPFTSLGPDNPDLSSTTAVVLYRGRPTRPAAHSKYPHTHTPHKRSGTMICSRGSSSLLCQRSEQFHHAGISGACETSKSTRSFHPVFDDREAVWGSVSARPM